MIRKAERTEIYTRRNKRTYMLNLILFGPPGSGKGTQSSKLVEHYNLCHLSTGDIFRANKEQGTELGKLAQSYMDKGNLVPDEVTIKMFESEVQKAGGVTGFIFDGFPRTTAQAEALDQFLVSRNQTVALMTALNVPEEELVARVLERGKDSGRADDNDESTIRKRISVYQNQTAIVASHYQAQHKYEAINGVGSVDEVFERLCEAIDVVA